MTQSNAKGVGRFHKWPLLIPLPEKRKSSRKKIIRKSGMKSTTPTNVLYVLVAGLGSIAKDLLKFRPNCFISLAHFL